jgi:flagellin-like protein
MNKKAVSEVVSTVLIIMITVAAVGIIMAWVIPMIRNNVDKGSACFDAQSDIALVTDGGYTCIINNATGWDGTNVTSGFGNISLQIRKGPSTKIELADIQILVSNQGNTQSVYLNQTMPGNNEEKTYVISSQKYNNAESIKIAPVVKIGSTNQVCDISQTVPLSTCINA